jgi:hypothetical protein
MKRHCADTSHGPQLVENLEVTHKKHEDEQRSHERDDTLPVRKMNSEKEIVRDMIDLTLDGKVWDKLLGREALL